MSATVTESNPSDGASRTATAKVPKRITNAQTVCNEKNEKGKLCNGHLKQLRTAGEAADVHLRGDDVLSRCQTCGTIYVGPPLGHVRDPQKQQRFVEAELTALLQAAGGTLPVVQKNEKGVFVIVEPAAEAAPAATKPAATAASPAVTGTAGVPPAPSTPVAAAPAKVTATPAAKPPAAKQHKVGAAPNRELFKRSTYVGVADTGPVAGETFAQKVERLKKVSAAAKLRQEEGGGPATKAAEVVEAAAARVRGGAVNNRNSCRNNLCTGPIRRCSAQACSRYEDGPGRSHADEALHLLWSRRYGPGSRRDLRAEGGAFARSLRRRQAALRRGWRRPLIEHSIPPFHSQSELIKNSGESTNSHERTRNNTNRHAFF